MTTTEHIRYVDQFGNTVGFACCMDPGCPEHGLNAQPDDEGENR